MAEEFRSFYRIPLLIVFLAMASALFAQTKFKSEEQMIQEADKLFENEEYVKAFEYYQTLLSNHRDNIEYTYRFGVCMLYSDKRDKGEPIKYLEKAAQSPEIDVKVFYFLGRAYHQNYRFNEAKLMYQRYKNEAKSRVVAKYNIDRRIQECNNGLALLAHFHLYYVVNKVVVKQSTFYRAYDLSNSGGMVIIMPEELQTKYDRKHNSEKTAFYIPSDRILYFSSYGVKNLTGKDIYRAHQLSDGGWSAPEKLSAVINTKYDESYPFVTPDGKTLYFSSKGHNTMGGYDVFKSTFNNETYEWSEPENLNFPINTPFDDLFFVPDTADKFANFSSNRSSVSGLIYVYKISLEDQAEEENLAQALLESDNPEKAAELIKEVADMNTNVDVSEYKKKLAEIKDTTLAQNEVERKTEKQTASEKQQAETIALSGQKAEEAVDSVFSIYRDYEYRLAGFKKRKAALRKLEQHYKNQSATDENQATQNRNTAELASEITRQIDRQIIETERAKQKLMNIAANMQYYQGKGMNDSVQALYQKALDLQQQTTDNDDAFDEVVNAQYAQLKKKREQASKYYDLAQKYDKEFKNLTKERNEYQAEADRLTDPDAKREYLDLVKDMDAEIAKTKANKEKYFRDWKATREDADSLARQMTQVEELANNYHAQTRDVNFETMAFVDETKRRQVEEQIAQSKQLGGRELLALNANVAEAQLPEANENNSSRTEELKADDNKAAAAELALAKESKDDTIQNREIVAGEKPLDPDAWKRDPNLKALISNVNQQINQVNDLYNQQRIKEAVSRKMAIDKYEQYQKLSEETDAELSAINLNTDLSPEERTKKLERIKRNIEKATDLKREAAVSFAFADEYAGDLQETGIILDSLEQDKVQMESLLASGNYQEARVVAGHAGNISAALVARPQMAQEAQGKVTEFEAERDLLIQKKDSLQSFIEDMKVRSGRLGDNEQQIAEYDQKILDKKRELNKLQGEIDFMDARIAANKKIMVLERDIENQAKTTKEPQQITSYQKPAEFKDMEGLVTVFSKQVMEQEMSTVDAYLQTAVVAQNTGIPADDKEAVDSVTQVPVYNNDEKEALVQEILLPETAQLKAINAQNRELDKRIIATLSIAKNKTEQLKQKNTEIEAAYAGLDSTISLADQPDQVEKIKNLEQEALLLNREQEAAVQLANVLKTKRENNLNQAQKLQAEIEQIKNLIAENKLDEAKAAATMLNNKPIDSLVDSELLIASYVNKIEDRNQEYERRITSIETELTIKNKQKTRLEQKLASIKEKQTSANDNAELRNELDSTQQQIAAIESEIDFLNGNINRLKSQKEANTILLTYVKQQAHTVEQQAGEVKVDDVTLANASRVPVVAVNTDVFAPDYLEQNSGIKALEQQQAQKELLAEKADSVEPEIAADVAENSIIGLKRNLLISEIAFIDQEMNTLSIKRSKLSDINKKEELSAAIEDLQVQRNELQASLDALPEVGMGVNEVNADNVLSALQQKRDALTKEAEQLRAEAETLKGKERKAKIAAAEEKERIAMQINLEITDIVAIRNRNNYRKNSAELARYSDDQLYDVRAAKAIDLIQSAKDNMSAADSRRFMAAEDGYTESERREMIQKATDYEEQAISAQEKALTIYKKLDVEPEITETQIIALNNKPEEKAVAEQEAAIERAAEEIPQDKPEQSRKQTDAKEAPVPPNAQKNAIPATFIPVYGISMNNQTSSSQTADIPDNKVATPEGLVYKIQLSSSKTAATIEQFNGIGPVAADHQTDDGTTDYVAGQFANYKDASLARKAVQDKGFEGAFVVAYFDGKRISTQEAERLIESGEAYTAPELAKLAAEQNSEFYTRALALNEDTTSTADIQEEAEVQQEVVVENAVEITRKLETNITQDVTVANEVQEDNKSVAAIVASGQDLESQISTEEMGVEYSADENLEQPIELNIDIMPDGLVYKVQVAALRRKVPLSTFGGIKPITAEPVPNSSFIRYMAGVFPNYDVALSARDNIRGMGFSDAFIVVYFNGRRISLNEARQLIASGEAYTAPELIQYSKNNNMVYYTANSTVAQGANGNMQEPVNRAAGERFELKKIKLYYTVQVGVYGGPRSLDRMYNLRNLFYDRTASGYYRYFSGKYASEKAAVNARNVIRTNAVPDAFVVAFADGKRISLAKARKIEQDGRVGRIIIIRESMNGRVAPKQTIALNNNSGQLTQTMKAQNTSDNLVMVQQADNPSEGIVFRVQLGAFRGARTQEQLQVINAMSENGISSYTTPNGLVLFFTNTYKTYQQALAARDRIRAAGHTDVFVVAMQNGKKISVQQALDLLNN